MSLFEFIEGRARRDVAMLFAIADKLESAFLAECEAARVKAEAEADRRALARVRKIDPVLWGQVTQ